MGLIWSSITVVDGKQTARAKVGGPREDVLWELWKTHKKAMAADGISLRKNITQWIVTIKSDDVEQTCNKWQQIMINTFYE